VAKSDQSWLARMEQRLMHLFGPADVRAADSQRPVPAPPPAASGPVIQGELAPPDRPGA
jgi:hypothetical protein